jgi:cyclic beta-1,2-glucan synthetase
LANRQLRSHLRHFFCKSLRSNLPHFQESAMTSLATETAVSSPAAEAFEPFALGKEPIRGESHGLEHLEALARNLAHWAVVATDVPGIPIQQRFEENRSAFIKAHRLIADAYRQREAFGSDAEWLLDNFHIVSDALDEIRTDLPGGYYRLLPKLARPPLAGFPRVYIIAVELIAHTDSSLSEVNITRFIQAFQAVAPLTIGELWAVPIMLRLVLVENLRRLAEQIVLSHTSRHHAQAWASHLLSLPEGSSLHSALHSPPPALHPQSEWTESFMVHFLELLREQVPILATASEWLETMLVGRGTCCADVVRREQQRQAANQVSIGNSVTSLRILSALDWPEFFEKTSLVEAILRQDPAGTYPGQDFATRDRYRRRVEKLARGSQQAELEVALQAVGLANRDQGVTTPDNHVGYYLIDRGQARLERALGYHADLRDRFVQAVLGNPRVIYFGGIAMTTAALLLGLTALAFWGYGAGLKLLCLTLLVAVLPASEVAVSFVNYAVSFLVPPRVLPKMDYRRGIPQGFSTFVVVPGMLSQDSSGGLLVERLELHYLSNPDPALRFAILTDFADAPAEHQSNDERFLNAAVEGIKALNQRYARNGMDRFFLCHRRRKWNAVQGCWMGWERKRGKLLEFNRLIRGDKQTSFGVIVGDIAQLPPPRFVITLDADTQLPREAAQRLVATLGHPLNQPRFDPSRGRVVAGYGILQPRISLSLPAARKSIFARIFSGSAGLDPYTNAVSDVYQDLFGSGSYTGKGIYDVDAFEAATGHTFPENRILSHDLLEGNYARCGLATDIELFDEFPALFHAYARRQHRWVRGDWQILAWLFPKVPDAQGKWISNPLPAVERWKIFDNLRRSLLPPTLVLLLALGWTVLPAPNWFWSLLVVFVLGWKLLPPLLTVPIHLFHGLVRARRWNLLPAELFPTVGQVLLGLIFLAEEAFSMIDAVVRTLVRLYATHRHFLEWETAASAEHRLGRRSLVLSWETCRAPAQAVVLLVAIALARPAAVPAALPILAGWIISPVVATWVSRTRHVLRPELSAADRRQLHAVARRTWSFFETFITEEDHWLPPDNYQENRKEATAHRTSPTNIGLYLLSCLAAHDFGYVTLSGLVERLEKTFATLALLERSHGHFYNWYDTKTLHPLHPTYLSTVDSGNLLACLIALKNGLLDLTESGRANVQTWHGLADVLEVFATELRALEAPGDADALALVRKLETTLQGMETFVTAADSSANDERRLAELEPQADELARLVGELANAIKEPPEELAFWAKNLADQIQARRAELKNEVGRPDVGLLRLAHQAETFAKEMDFRVLYNEQRQIFSVGYNLSVGRQDNAHYDLLASEACLTSFLAVARGEVPRQHWFQVARYFTRAANTIALMSWGGTMFEYLMPRLLLPSFPGTILDDAQTAAVTCQIDYGKQRRTPWGISESAFNTMDGDLNYQYQAFGVPSLGLKRGLAKDLVIAPYACLLASPIMPTAVVANLRRLQEEGALGRYGYYEALDYTPDRLQEKRKPAVVKCFMAHHQGMAFVALANCLQNNRMPARFRAEPFVRATELLLQERVPQGIRLMEAPAEEAPPPALVSEDLYLLSRRLTTPHTPHPRTHLLSSGQYTVMLTNAGGGYSTCRGIGVSRWREDRTCDAWGQFIYIKDTSIETVWSAGYQPTRRDGDEYEVFFSIDKAEIRRVDADIETRMEVTVSPEHHAEVRRLTFTNHTSRHQTLEVTSYAEIVLAPRAADQAHPAFGKLFLQTEFVSSEHALLCQRRTRSVEENPLWAVHVLAVDGRADDAVQFETDRARFIGRYRTTANPAALDSGVLLSGTVGPVLDPIFSLRRQVTIAPDTSISIAFTTGVADSREEALALADHYHDFNGVSRAFELAWAHSQVQLRHWHVSAEEAHLYQRLAGHVIYASPALRTAPDTSTGQQQSALWRLGISGDNPIVLVRIDQPEQMSLVRELVAAHAEWRRKSLDVDLVILNEHESGYFEDLQQQLLNMVRASDERTLIDKPGGVFLRKLAPNAKEDRLLLGSVARCTFIGGRGSLATQLERGEGTLRSQQDKQRQKSKVSRGARRGQPAGGLDRWHNLDLQFPNGLGGFAADGREYFIQITANSRSIEVNGRVKRKRPLVLFSPERMRIPPAPWINVVANSAFGFLVTESGGGCTWAENSQQNRLTPWQNDPVCDPPGEVIYLRDEASGETWSATPLPAGMPASYIVTHGQGYTSFECQTHELHQELLLLMPTTEPIKLIRLKLRNLSRQHRQLSTTFFAEWVLGATRPQAGLRVMTEVDTETGALLARNFFNGDKIAPIAFADVDSRPRTLIADRTVFLGRNGSPRMPAWLDRPAADKAARTGADPCAAIQVMIELATNEEKEITFLLGAAANVAEVRRLLTLHKRPGKANRVLVDVQQNWSRILETIQVRTPNRALDLLLNRWLLYQVLSCRVWGRSGYYQSSGAYGFRDQLQDVMALVYAAPQEARAQILRCAARQFREGDVQHWWHPASGAGVRTRISDDYLWLPYVACHYLNKTGDVGILDERIPCLEAPALRPDQDEDYRSPDVTTDAITLYEHCTRAIDHAMRFGPHGLPLMGTGDWNDGMNRVGARGQGESVWNAWFLLSVLRDFIPLGEKRGDSDRARTYRQRSRDLVAAVEEHAWDGKWYRRAYFDDGTPLGSAENDECRIDSIAQSWAVMSAAANPDRARQAMASVQELLVREKDRIIALFTPPFADGKLQPGYIKGYVPGIRENGGQYTHAAVWTVAATALLGQGNRAMQLLNFLNPIHHTATPDAIARYRLEPYALAGDVYGEPPHVGRGGWSWYTGSAAWYYRVALETILGFQLEGDRLRINPCIPSDWEAYEIDYRYRDTTYRIRVENPEHLEAGIPKTNLDGRELSDGWISLQSDRQGHQIRIVLSRAI